MPSWLTGGSAKPDNRQGPACAAAPLARPRAVRVLVAAALVLSALDLLRYAGVPSTLSRECQTWTQMTPWTAALTTLVALSLLVRLRTRLTTSGRVFVTITSTVSLAIVLTLMFEHLSGGWSEIDRLWFGQALQASQCQHPGRPPIDSLLALGMLALAVGSTSGQAGRWGRFVSVSVSGALSAYAILWQAIAAANGHIVQGLPSAGMAITTALVLQLLAIAASLTWPSDSVLGWMTATPDRARNSRLVLVLLVFPTTLLLVRGLLTALNVDSGHVELLSGVLGTAVLGVAIWRHNAREHTYLLAQVQLSQALAQSEAGLRLLLEHSADVVIAAAEDGRMTWVSQAVDELLGWRPEDFVGQQVVEFVHPDDQAAIRSMQYSLDHGQDGHLELRFRTAQGGWRWVNARVRTLVDADGAIIGRVASIRDADAEHAVRAALEASEQHFRMVADNSVDVVLKFGVDQDLVWVSPSVVHAQGGRRGADSLG